MNLELCTVPIFRECPLDLKEAISSICFAAPRSADLPELMQVQMFFAAKYGKEFVTAATELLPDCGVNRQVMLAEKHYMLILLEQNLLGVNWKKSTLSYIHLDVSYR